MTQSWTSLLLAWILANSPGETTCELQHPELNESSGVCVSADGKLVWTHNDSGDSPRLFGFQRNGDLAVVAKVKGARAVDWEDICAFERDGKRYLAIGDVGDNQRRRKSVTIYVLKEPDVEADNLPQALPSQGQGKHQPEIEIPVLHELQLSYPDGPLDCEGIAYDPRSDTFLLTSKELLRTRLFTVDASNLQTTQWRQAVAAGVLLVPMVTAVDLSRDGSRMVLATYGPGCVLTKAQHNTWSDIADKLVFFELPQRRQGESICFDHTGQTLLLTSEFSPTPLISVPAPRPNPALPLD